MTTDTDVQIQPLTAKHLAQVVEIEETCFDDAWPLSAFRDSILNPPTAWVALKETQVVGYLITQTILDEIHLYNIAVREDFQRQGIASRLMIFLIQKAQTEDMQRIILEVRASNLAAVRFYQQSGFRELYLRKRYYDDGEDARVMERRVPQDS